MNATTSKQMTKDDVLVIIRNAFWNASQDVKGKQNKNILSSLGYAILKADEIVNEDQDPFIWQTKLEELIVHHIQNA